MRLSSRLLALLVLLAGYRAAPAQTIHVAPCGNDSWTGASSECVAADGPKASIQAAIDAASNGYEVLVAPGTYNGDVNLMGKEIWLHSTGGQEVTTVHGHVSIINGEGPLTIFEGFTVTNYPLPRQGMRILNSSPTVQDCTFYRNEVVDHALGGAGMMVVGPPVPTVTRCRFVGNVARGQHFSPTCGARGGGFYLRGAPMTITNCVFSRNLAIGGCLVGPQPYGGAVFIEPHTGASMSIINCTMAGNLSPGPGYWSHAVYTTTSLTLVINCALGWNQLMLGAVQINNCFEPQFLQNPGPGPDLTPGTPDDEFGDLRLRPGSPCIDSADNTYVPVGLSIDRDGNPRFMNDRGVVDTGVPGGDGGTTIADAGAYEYQGTSGVLNYCYSAPNMSGQPAVIGFQGSTSIAADDFSLLAGPLGPGQSGVFFFGDARAHEPMGEGFLCVGGNVTRLLPSVTSNEAGVVTMDVDMAWLDVGAGETRNFQLWFRDHSRAGVNLTDALAVTFVP